MSESILKIQEDQASYILALGLGSDSERIYAGRWWICENPFCACTELEFVCARYFRDSSESDVPLNRFTLDLQTRAFSRAKSAENRELGREVAQELTEEDWLELWKILYHRKAGQIRKADLNTRDIVFPREVAREGKMVGYKEIFPLAPGFPFEMDGRKYIADDMYCVQPGCDCRQAVLAVLSVNNDGDMSVTEQGRVRYSLDNLGVTEVLESGGDTMPPVKNWVRALEETQPDLSKEMRFRNKQLNELFRANYIPTGVTKPVKAGRQVGRNEPCPCGSGKKFKKCCGQS